MECPAVTENTLNNGVQHFIAGDHGGPGIRLSWFAENSAQPLPELRSRVVLRLGHSCLKHLGERGLFLRYSVKPPHYLDQLLGRLIELAQRPHANGRHQRPEFLEIPPRLLLRR